MAPQASPFDKQQRRKLWQAVLLQDTFLTVLLSLPPSATHSDVMVEDLREDDSSISSDDPTDTAYIRGSWALADLVQEAVCSPRSLDVPICTTIRHRSKLVASFRAVYRSFPDIFRSWDSDSLAALAHANKRVVRQTLFLSSNYYHNLMLVYASESPEAPANLRGTLECAHDAITTFFLLFSLFGDEARVWWVFNHRAFLEALCVGNVLKEVVASEPGGEENLAKDPLYARARNDIRKSFFNTSPYDAIRGCYECLLGCPWCLNALFSGAPGFWGNLPRHFVKTTERTGEGTASTATASIFSSYLSQIYRLTTFLDRMIEIMQIMGQGEQGSETARVRARELSAFLI